MGKLIINEKKLDYSKSMQCKFTDDGTSELSVEIGSDKEKNPYVMKNMQDDNADFEAIAFCVWSIKPECRITLKFDECKWEGKTLIQEQSEMQHYMRFLYRVNKMLEFNKDRFFIDKSNQKQVTTFKKLYDKAKEDGNLYLTYPDSKSNVSLKTNDKDQPARFENMLEKCFVVNARNNQSEINHITKCSELFDQFPCGLFLNEKKNINRIFNTGYFDLWGVNDNGNFTVFELKKKGNIKLGIISELFFYSCFAIDSIDIAKKNFNNTKKKSFYRGLDKFLKITSRKVNAYFLVPEFHSFIDDNKDAILKQMNRMNNGVTYDAINFDQEIIEKEIEKAGGTDKFLKKLSNQLKEHQNK